MKKVRLSEWKIVSFKNSQALWQSEFRYTGTQVWIYQHTHRKDISLQVSLFYQLDPGCDLQYLLVYKHACGLNKC